MRDGRMNVWVIEIGDIEVWDLIVGWYVGLASRYMGLFRIEIVRVKRKLVGEVI